MSDTNLNLIAMGFFNSLFSKKKSERELSAESQLDWPDTSNWNRIDASIMKEGLTLVLPPNMKYYLYESGITLRINERVCYTIETVGSYNSFDMQENRDWINDPDNRENIQWLIDTPHFAYFTGQDVSASVANQTTHSCFGEKWIDGQHFHMHIDGIVIDDDFSYNLSQRECLTFVRIFESIQ